MNKTPVSRAARSRLSEYFTSIYVASIPPLCGPLRESLQLFLPVNVSRREPIRAARFLEAVPGPQKQLAMFLRAPSYLPRERQIQAGPAQPDHARRPPGH